MAEHTVFVREAGEEDFDIVYVSEKVTDASGESRPLSLEDLHQTIQDALGRSLFSDEEILKITLDNIAIRNANGLRFMFKKDEPKLEVTFTSTGSKQAAQAQEAQFQAPVVPVQAPQYSSSPVPPGSPAQNWVTQLEQNPHSFGHTGVTINEHLFVFGGFADDFTANHCLLLSDTKKGRFQLLRVRGDVPSARERTTGSLIGKNIYLFGGFNRHLEAYYNDVYVFESETLSFRKLEPRGQIPDRRCGHTANVIDDKIWVFGGRVKVKKSGKDWFSGSGVAYTNDLFCFDPLMNEWRRYEPRGIGPSGRAMHSGTVVGRKIYYFGGANSSGSRRDTSAFCDLYELDVDTMTWTECETKGTPPTPCYGHTATNIGSNKILFFGGKAYNVLNALHILDVSTMEWKQYAFAGAPPKCRWGHSATLHDTRVLLYGGRDDNGYHSSYDVIDTATQLIDIPPEELERDKHKKKLEERYKNQQMMGDLQRDVEDLKAVINQIGEALVRQTRQSEEMSSQIRGLAEANLALKKELDLLKGSNNKVEKSEKPAESVKEGVTKDNVPSVEAADMDSEKSAE